MSFGGGGDQDPIEETPEMRELARISAEKWNIAQEYEPVMDEYMERVDELSSQGAEDYVQGKASLSNQNAFSSAKTNAKAKVGLSGVDPSSGRAIGLDTSFAQTEGANAGKAIFDAGFEKDTQSIAGQQNILDISLGKTSQAQAGLSDIARMSSEEAISDAYNAFNEKAANAQAFGTVAGIGGRIALNDYMNKNPNKQEGE